MPDRLRLGVLGAAWIADRALIPAIGSAANAEVVAIAARDPDRAAAMAARHHIGRVHSTYEDLIEDAGVDAVYVALANSEHSRWSIRALHAGKHVLCEKPLATSAAEARTMAEASAHSGCALMEAFMYRFHPRMRELRETAGTPRSMHAGFSFTLQGADNYRFRPELGGGALLDVGCYTLDVIRWFLGEPVSVRATATTGGGGVDMTVAAALGFAGGAHATAWASFEAPEHQELALVTGSELRRIHEPFTAWRDPHDPYQLMVEAFAAAVLSGATPPRSLEDSIATATLLDRVRDAATPLSR